MAAKSADASSSTKCYTAVIRRLLCSGSFPTHPSDQFSDSNIEKIGAEKCSKPEENAKQSEKSNPGVVARLMGLDSFPNTPLGPKDKTLGSFFRSRSVNSIDFVSHFDPVKQHRRVRTSVSFREGINYDYYYSNVVLHLENEEDGKRVKRGRSENSEKLKEERVINKPGKKVEMGEQKRSVCVNAKSEKKDFNGKIRKRLKERRPVIKVVNYKEELMGTKCWKKKQNKNLGHKLHSGCGLHKVHPEKNVTEIARGENSRLNLPSKIVPCSSIAHSHNGEVREISKGKKEMKLKNKESCYYKRMVEIICRLTEEGIEENWMHRVVLKFDDFEEICQLFGQEILEVLVRQFVDELVGPTSWDKE